MSCVCFGMPPQTIFDEKGGCKYISNNRKYPKYRKIYSCLGPWFEFLKPVERLSFFIDAFYVHLIKSLFNGVLESCASKIISTAEHSINY